MEFDRSLYLSEEFFALNQLDLKLKDYLSFTGGFFIEAGANNGVSQSNTMYFEKYRNWRGILIEPIPSLAEECKVNRPNCIVENCALVPFDYQEPEIEMYYCNLVSMVKGAQKTKEEELKHLELGRKVQAIESYELSAPARTLTSILDQHKVERIDLLSLDVEGFELNVLKGLDFARYQPDFLLIEARYRDEIDNFLSPYYTPIAELSHHDVLYKSKKKIEEERKIKIFTPVAFFVSDRMDLAQEVFNAIAQVKPQKLLVISNDAQSEPEAKSSQNMRSIIDQINWGCEVLINFPDANLGHRNRVTSGLDWVFSNVEEAIIIRDDCLPSISFFHFCQVLLERYRSDERIFSITGHNFQFGRTRTEFSYYFSRYPCCGGWATWRRAWQHFDIQMKLWKSYKAAQLMDAVFEDPEEHQYWLDVLDETYKHPGKNWEYPWFYTCWNQNGLTIVPETNLVLKLEFSSNPSHANGDPENLLANIPTGNIWNIKHSPFVGRHSEADAFTSKHVFGVKQTKQLAIEQLQKIQAALAQTQIQLNQTRIQGETLVDELETLKVQNQDLYFKLDQTQVELEQVRSKRKDLQLKFKAFKSKSFSKLQIIQGQLREEKEKLRAMEVSKFWKVRNTWVRLKQLFRIG